MKSLSSYKDNIHKCLFDLYDRIHFKGQLGSKLGDEKIEVRYSDWVVSRIENSPPEYLYGIFGTTDKLRSLMTWYEHQLTHIIMYISGYNDTQSYNKIFEDIVMKIFDSNTLNVMKNLSNPVLVYYPNLELRNIGGYKYWENSCNTDCLSTILLFSDATIFKRLIFETNSFNVRYNKNIVNIVCEKKRNEFEWDEFVSKLQSYYINDYHKIASGNKIRCSSIRKLLLECFPSMKSGKSWNTYNVSEIYSIIANSFPVLLFDKIPYVIIDKHGNVSSNKISYSESPKEVFTFWEYMDPMNDIDDKAQYILWDNFEYPILAFRNGGFPTITEFGNTNSETINVFGVNYVINKRRCFGETIIKGKYEIIGAIILQGVEPGKEGGIHYVAYLKVNGRWVFYNDMNDNVFTRLDSFPVNVLSEYRGDKPEMYFYKRT